MRFLRAAGWLCLAALTTPAAEPPAPTSDPVYAAFDRLYNFDFPGTHALLNREIAADPADPLPYAVRAAAHLFSELDRLGILEAQFLLSDGRITAKTGSSRADPGVRAALFQAIDQARSLAQQRMARDSQDRRALFSLCVVSGIETDYVALVEKRQWRSLNYAKRSQAYAVQLLKLDPTFYDAYLTAGVSEYLLGSLPFFLRWFVHFDGANGDKRKAIENLEQAARSGRYLGPFAKILLGIVCMREKRPADSRRWLQEFQRDYPRNPLVSRELARLAGSSQP